MKNKKVLKTFIIYSQNFGMYFETEYPFDLEKI